ncbi:MAG: peptidylprolyl isomerase [Sphingobacteriales bacterium]|nr:MAG: peptidylprolyl isomerase [Sphingobacteriales bacterium]
MKKLLILAAAFAVSTAGPALAQETKTKTNKKGDTKIKSGDTKIKIDREDNEVKIKNGDTKEKISLSRPVDYDAMGFKRTTGGLLYKFIVDAPGSNSPKLGDNVEMHINTHIGDSSLFNSRKLNNNQPVPFQIMAPSFKGDLVEGFMLMTPGDSAVFMVSVDSLMHSGAQLLPWMKAGDMIEYEVALVTVKSQETMKAEAEMKSAGQKKTDDSLLQDYFKKNKIKATKTASGLYYVVTKKGTGPTPKAGEKITVNYTGKTMDGTKFDSNVDSAFNHVQPFSFNVGQRQVIAGWDEGLMLLNKGGKATLYIPSGLAYGERSPSPKIPANGILIFDVEVTEITPAAPANVPPGHSEGDGHRH